MNISRATYDHAARRVGGLAILVFPLFGAVGCLVMFFVGFPAVAAVRALVGGNVGMALAIASVAPFVLLPLLLPMAAMVTIDRRVGIRCPNCRVSLTIRCLPEKVLITRRCSHCNATVLLDDEFESRSPNTNPWIIVALVAFGAVGIAVAITLHMVAPADNRMDVRDEVVESGALLVAVLAIWWVQSVVMRTMKRRWKRQAAGHPITESDVNVASEDEGELG